MNMKYTFALVFLAGFLLFCAADLQAENIDPDNDGSQYAYGENVGWLNFEPNLPDPNVGASVSQTKVTGFIWAENIGWINLSPATYGGVNNDGAGNLSGYAWGENVGWINFDPNVLGDPTHYGVTIDSDGDFDGWAWGENVGWIHFQSAPTCTKTAWSIFTTSVYWLPIGSTTAPTIGRCKPYCHHACS